MSAISLKNIYKSYDRPVIDDFSIEIEEGERIALFGASGSGKTTLLRIIARLENVQSGEIYVDGKISYAFQEPRLFDDFSILENITCVGASRDEALYLIERALLGDCADKKPRQLSGGMKQRVSVVRALAFDADVYLFDEPLKELDPDSKRSLAELINERTKGKTVLLVTHETDDAELLLCKRKVNVDTKGYIEQ